MSVVWVVTTGLLTAAGSIVSFLLGRIYSQSEIILSEKRRVYEEFLEACPRPNQAYYDFSDEELGRLNEKLEVAMAKMSLYASTEVSLAVSI